MGQLVTRNEYSRWLDCCLFWNVPILDGVHVYDDQSRDATVAVADSHGCKVTRRPDGVPPLMVHEGRFREAAWRAFEAALEPEPGDFVLAFDADEFLVSLADEMDSVQQACLQASEDGAVGIMLSIPEIFDLSDQGTRPSIRMDGYWPTIEGIRLFEWRPGGRFADLPLGSGSAPTYVSAGPINSIQGMWLLHYGYAVKADREEKYERYRAMPGHAPGHVASIVQEPVLRLWDGPHFNVWRGTR